MAERIQVSGTKVMVIGLEYPQEAEYPNIRFNSELMGGRLYAASVIDLFEYLQEEKKPAEQPGLEWAIQRCNALMNHGFTQIRISAFKQDLEVALEAFQSNDSDSDSAQADRVTKWKSTSADDLKSSLNCQVNNDPAGTAEDCLYALLHGDVKAKTHRKHIAAALRAASKQLEEVPHV